MLRKETELWVIRERNPLLILNNPIEKKSWVIKSVVMFALTWHPPPALGKPVQATVCEGDQRQARWCHGQVWSHSGPGNPRCRLVFKTQVLKIKHNLLGNISSNDASLISSQNVFTSSWTREKNPMVMKQVNRYNCSVFVVVCVCACLD